MDDSPQGSLTGIRGRNMYYESTKIALFTLGVESFMDCNKHINKSIKRETVYRIRVQ